MMILPSIERLGLPGVIGLGLMLFALSFYLSNVAPARAELASLRQQEAQLRAEMPATTDADAGRPAVSEALPPISAFPELLKELNALAEQRGVTIERASYTLSDRDGKRRMEINLPLKASYLSLRIYLRDVLMLRASPSLDELTLKRQQATDTVIEANVRLSYQFAPAP
jgi:hypothetical protein